MNDARYPNISAIDNRLAELENEKQQLLALREALRSAQIERSIDQPNFYYPNQYLNGYWQEISRPPKT